MSLKDEILDCTNRGLEVFCFYMPIDFVLKRNFRNPLYDDHKASCNIYFDAKQQCYRMKDFGNDFYSGDCFWFAAMMLGLDVRTEFPKVLASIIRDLQLDLSIDDKQTPAPHPMRKYKNRHNEKEENQGMIKTDNDKKWYKCYEQVFQASELSYWLKYGITTKTLQRYNVKSLVRYEALSNQGKTYTLLSSQDEPMFCYMMGNFVKVYRPFSKLRFVYGGEKREDYIFGFEQLPNKGDMLFITGGEKDVLSLSAHHFHAICFNSETATIPENVIESLLLRFWHIIILYDTDETGVREAQRQVDLLSQYNVLTLLLPLQGIKREKDISDFFALGRTEE